MRFLKIDFREQFVCALIGIIFRRLSVFGFVHELFTWSKTVRVHDMRS
jgi:hypothetical protein